MQDSSPVHLIFAGLARDCADTVEKNISSILSFVEDPRVGSLEVLIAENDSRDDTQLRLQKLSQVQPEVTLFLLPSLDQQFSGRIERIAYCRQYLLDYIRTKELAKSSSRTIYVPVDLDSNILASIDHDVFLQACLLLLNSKEFDALFPLSTPYYYDILALRARDWCQSDCVNDLLRYQKLKSRFIYQVARLWLIMRRQRSSKVLAAHGSFHPVESAFGGFGLYAIASITEAQYYSPLWPKVIFQESNEHVLFNRVVPRKAIYSKLLVAAPMEHLTLADSRNFWPLSLMLISAFFADFKSLLDKLVFRIASLFHA